LVEVEGETYIKDKYFFVVVSDISLGVSIVQFICSFDMSEMKSHGKEIRLFTPAQKNMNNQEYFYDKLELESLKILAVVHVHFWRIYDTSN
jgi:hypothetical protein